MNGLSHLGKGFNDNLRLGSLEVDVIINIWARLVWDLGFTCDWRIQYSGPLDMIHVVQIGFPRVGGSFLQARPRCPLYFCTFLSHHILFDPGSHIGRRRWRRLQILYQSIPTWCRHVWRETAEILPSPLLSRQFCPSDGDPSPYLAAGFSSPRARSCFTSARLLDRIFRYF
jgi:hypothetical protein